MIRMRGVSRRTILYDCHVLRQETWIICWLGRVLTQKHYDYLSTSDHRSEHYCSLNGAETENSVGLLQVTVLLREEKTWLLPPM